MNKIQVVSEVTGNIWQIECAVGDKVSKDDILMVLESMKMEIPVEAPCAGTIFEICVREHDSVEENQTVLIMNAG